MLFGGRWMKLLRKQDFEEIKLWMHRNARAIELARWQYHFENGSKENVLAALLVYQNPDGGFGNALEPDSWNPYSTPYTTDFAIKILKEIDAIDMTHPMLQGIVTYLESKAETNENGWLFSVPSNDSYPHAPWWTYNPEANVFESIGVTAGLVDFILRYVDKTSELYGYAMKLLEQLVQRMDIENELGEMGVSGYIDIRAILKNVDVSTPYDLDKIDELVNRLVNTTIEHDVSKWVTHCKTPRDFIQSPKSEFYLANKEITEYELDYIIETRRSNGVWDISWSWYENNDKYAKEFAIVENWWKAHLAITTVLHLKNFNRME